MSSGGQKRWNVDCLMEPLTCMLNEREQIQAMILKEFKIFQHFSFFFFCKHKTENNKQKTHTEQLTDGKIPL